MSTTAVKYQHIEKPADGPARFESHPRMRVSHIIGSFFAHGWSPAEMCRQYPFLKIAEVHAAMAYYYDNREEIEQELEEDLRLFDSYRERDSDSPFKRRMKAEGRLAGNQSTLMSASRDTSCGTVVDCGNLGDDTAS